MERHSKSGLQLLELCINLLFFCIILTICVQFFVRSYKDRKESECITFAVNEVCNMAEILNTNDISLPEITEYFENAYISEDNKSATVYYDKDYNETDANDFYYRMDVTVNLEEDGTSADIDYFKTESDGTASCLYSVSIFSHTRLTADEGGM